jgi:hypothetical protein
VKIYLNSIIKSSKLKIRLGSIPKKDLSYNLTGFKKKKKDQIVKFN